ncbi:trafficking protein particle complex subunit 6b [Anaeramoeba flamelloides]|uniref:Trafficking protein particle complex subunit 6b n=1 Tax=Anaeramoeba flamelloides TaxID=1746091 RepID=A0AAV8AHI4_9EUKA|nr:trafficking protein particle complex subunit 6b [Anaeramoeba flamelloides]
MSINYSIFESLFFEIVKLTERSVEKNPHQKIKEYPTNDLVLINDDQKKKKKKKNISIEEGTKLELFPIPNKQQLICKKLESVGFRLGSRLIEQYTFKKRCTFTEEKVVKLVLNDFWNYLFKNSMQIIYNKNEKVCVAIVYDFGLLSRLSFSNKEKKEKLDSEKNLVQEKRSEQQPNKNKNKKNRNSDQTKRLSENSNNSRINENEIQRKKKENKQKSKKNRQKLSKSNSKKKLNEQKQIDKEYQKNRIVTQPQMPTINKYLQLICGIIRGAFWNLNMNIVITTNYTNLSKIKFTIKVEN